MLDLTHLRLDDVQGVGTIELNLDPGKQAYVFIGANGVGKTKLLEAIFDLFIILNTEVDAYTLINTEGRGQFKDGSKNSNFLRKWIKESVALSSIFQRKKNNRQHYLMTILHCLHEIDPQYDSNFLEMDEKENIFIRVNNKEKELSELSTGFVSILKILTEIISAYGNMSQEKELQKIKGVVLIDEIESHLHLEWQVKIIPTLKKLFPNTTFFIATHSPLVLSQLEDGEAYELLRDEDDVVRTHKIKNPGNTAMIDLLKQAFHIDLNRLALDRPVSNAQKEAKKKLLNYLRERKAS